MLWHIGIVGGYENTYRCFKDEAQAELLITRMLNTWHHLGFAIDQPLFTNEPVKEWIAHQGTTVVRQMLLVIEDEVNDGTN